MEYLLKILSLPSPAVIRAAASTALVVIGLLLFRGVLLRIVFRSIKDTQTRWRWKRGLSYITGALFIVTVFPIWLPSIREVVPFLSIFGAGLLMVFKEVWMSIAGWFYILIRRPFQAGNRITIGGYTGDILDIRLLEIVMLEVKPREEGGQSTGRVLHVPNSIALTQPYRNAGREFTFNWNELTIPLKAGGDWRRGVAVVEEIADQAVEKIREDDERLKGYQESYGIPIANPGSRVYVEYQEGKVLLHLRFLAEPHDVRDTADMIWRAVLDRTEAEVSLMLAGAPEVSKGT